jgi:hypothetical protein
MLLYNNVIKTTTVSEAVNLFFLQDLEYCSAFDGKGGIL